LSPYPALPKKSMYMPSSSTSSCMRSWRPEP
jgi:hypothetical protein